ncbi:hypothetical protein BDZ91DRAFT_724192 [Kalaharituber pfeilii]|nr:hypothetical protein BDZ91DRAFT_724192 [Kalaharituber pfeilii]
MLQSEMFKIILPDAATSDVPHSPSNPGLVFYAQKELLASLSPELRNHIQNEMREGLKGEMVVADVDKVTLERFLQWAYTRDYTVDAKSQPPLMVHTKIYVLADRFNVPALQDLSFGRLTATLADHPILRRDFIKDMSIVLKVTLYAADNLPNLSKPPLNYLIRYITWGIESARILPEFSDLIHARPDVAVALFQEVQPPWRAPWSPPPSPRERVNSGDTEADECVVCQEKLTCFLLCNSCEQEADVCPVCAPLRRKTPGNCGMCNCRREMPRE